MKPTEIQSAESAGREGEGDPVALDALSIYASTRRIRSPSSAAPGTQDLHRPGHQLKAVGGNDAPITPLQPREQPGKARTSSLGEHVLQNDDYDPARARDAAGYASVVNAVAHDPNGSATANRVRRGHLPLKIKKDDNAPAVEGTRRERAERQHGLSRELYLHVPQQNKADEIRRVTPSPDGQKIVRGRRLPPLKHHRDGNGWKARQPGVLPQLPTGCRNAAVADRRAPRASSERIIEGCGKATAMGADRGDLPDLRPVVAKRSAALGDLEPGLEHEAVTLDNLVGPMHCPDRLSHCLAAGLQRPEVQPAAGR